MSCRYDMLYMVNVALYFQAQKAPGLQKQGAADARHEQIVLVKSRKSCFTIYPKVAQISKTCHQNLDKLLLSRVVLFQINTQNVFVCLLPFLLNILTIIKRGQNPLLYDKYKYYVVINILFKLNITSVIDTYFLVTVSNQSTLQSLLGWAS